MVRTSPQTVTRALNTLASWFRNSGIKVLERNGDGFMVLDATGTERRVTVAIEEGVTEPYAVDVKRLTNRKLSIGLAAFSELQAALGFKPQSPVNRGPVLDRKLGNGEDADLAAFRHTEFRRVPNPAPEKLASYQWLILQASKEFFSRQQWRCQDNMLDLDDLQSYAAVWTINFIGLYERADLTQTENDKLLHAYLIQRFNEFRTILINKERNELVKCDDAHIALHGRPHESRSFLPAKGRAGGRVAFPSDAPIVSSWEWAPEIEQEDDVGTGLDEAERRVLAEGAAARAAGIGQELSDRLAAMGHDQMVETLAAAVENGYIHPDARKEAEKRLAQHMDGCGQCSQTTPAVSGLAAGE